MKTSARISTLEQSVKTAFALADSRAAIAAEHAPSPGHTPASKIAAALRSESIQADAVKSVGRIRDGIKSAITDAERELDDIEHEAADAVVVASFIVGESDALPSALPAHIQAAAIALKGQPSAATNARQLVLASDNATAETSRLRSRWLPRTKAAADQVVYKHAARIFDAAGLERKSRAAQLLADRARLKRNGIVARNNDRRIGGEL